MNWKKHGKHLIGAHALLSPSKYQWLKYDDDRILSNYKSLLRVKRGTDLHALAAEHIRLRVKMADKNDYFCKYVNDAISYRMKPEQLLYYNDICFGTADSISYRDGYLRIHDLKTGDGAVKIDQLMIYAAIFFLEYEDKGYKPENSKIELRIYQRNQPVIYHNPTADDIREVMNRLTHISTLLLGFAEMEEL